VSKWLEILGFGAQKERARGSPDVARRAARIRETMRWRGFDLSAYSDEEIVTESERLGGGVSETGETTEASREALAAALRERRASPPTSASPPADVTPPPPETMGAEMPSDAAKERPVEAGRQAAPSRRGRQPRQRRAPAPAGPDNRTSLVRLRHVFGIHSWRLAEGPDGALLRCPGCGRDRAIGRGSRPLPFQHEEPMDHAGAPEAEIPPPVGADDFLPGQATRERRSDDTPSLVGRLLASPWWVKMLAIFATFQIIGVLASLFRNG
jgi:hypothetical protein